MRLSNFSKDEIDYVTSVVFGPEIAPERCEVGFVFGATHPEAIQVTITAYRDRCLDSA